MKKNGFIATSLIYSFFLIFITLFLTIIADYLQDKVLLNTIEGVIKTDLNSGISISELANYTEINGKGIYVADENATSCQNADFDTNDPPLYYNVDSTNELLKLSGDTAYSYKKIIKCMEDGASNIYILIVK